MTKLIYPKPKRLSEELELEDVSNNRKFDCIFYEFCLDHATDFRYSSFSCNGCRHYHGVKQKEYDMKQFEELGKLILSEKELKK